MFGWSLIFILGPRASIGLEVSAYTGLDFSSEGSVRFAGSVPNRDGTPARMISLIDGIALFFMLATNPKVSASTEFLGILSPYIFRFLGVATKETRSILAPQPCGCLTSRISEAIARPQRCSVLAHLEIPGNEIFPNVGVSIALL